jgi:hypothetical protein
VAERVFTVDEANALLVEVRPLAEQLIAHRRALVAARSKRRRIAAQIAGNGGGLDAGRVVALEERVAHELREVARCVNAIHGLGVIVKDPDEGLVDFPSERLGQPVYLCWRVGEDEIGFWHGVDEGFAGRKPLPLE